MTTREKLHTLVDELSEVEVEAALVRLTGDHEALRVWADTDDRDAIDAAWARENAGEAIREEPW